MHALFADTPTNRRNLWLLFFAFCVFASVHYGFTKVAEGRSAMLRWQEQLLDISEGVNIAERHAYPNPPIMAILLYPLALLPPVALALTWFYLKVGMVFLAIYWTFRLVETPERPFPFLAQLLTMALMLRPILGDLAHGNVNLFILFLVIACLTAYRANRDILAGLVLALAIGCKITPALFIPYFIWKGAWRLLAGTLVGLMLFLYPGFIPAAILGVEENQQHLEGWYKVMVQPFVIEGKVTPDKQNQSLPGLVARLFTHVPSDSTWANDEVGYVPLAYHNLLSLSPESGKRIVQSVMLLFGLLVALTCWTPTLPRQGWRLAAEFSLVSLGMLLFSERTWKHHAVMLLLPFAVLAYVLVEYRGRRWLVAGTLVAAALLMAATSNGFTTRALAKLGQVYGAYTLTFVLLCVVLARLLWLEDEPAVADESLVEEPATTRVQRAEEACLVTPAVR